MPNPTSALIFARASDSCSVAASSGMFTRRPVMLVGSTRVARSLGNGMFASGFASQSTVTTGPEPAGVARIPSGAVAQPSRVRRVNVVDIVDSGGRRDYHRGAVGARSGHGELQHRDRR